MFGEVAGSARTGSAREGQEREYRYSWKRQNWFDNQREEHLAVRNKVGLFDMTSFGKSASRAATPGLPAKALRQRHGRGAGQIVYTQMLNERGGIEATYPDRGCRKRLFFLVVPGATLQRDLAWLRKHLATSSSSSPMSPPPKPCFA